MGVGGTEVKVGEGAWVARVVGVKGGGGSVGDADGVGKGESVAAGWTICNAVGVRGAGVTRGETSAQARSRRGGRRRTSCFFMEALR
jgi:hypothetical protein